MRWGETKEYGPSSLTYHCIMNIALSTEFIGQMVRYGILTNSQLSLLSIQLNSFEEADHLEGRLSFKVQVDGTVSTGRRPSIYVPSFVEHE